MPGNTEAIAERIRYWERRLRAWSEDTTLADERRRLEQELLFLHDTLGRLDRLPEHELDALGRRLAADPDAWLEHRA